MKLSNLLSKVLDGQKLVENMTEEVKKPKKEETKESTLTLETEKIETEPKAEEVVKVKSEVNEAETKQKHDEEIAAKIKAQIKPKAKTLDKKESPAKTMSVPDFAKLREMAKQARQSPQVPPPVTPPVADVEETAKTDTPQT